MKKALVVGINYPGTSSELRGCVNDADIISDTIINHFGFESSDVARLNDEEATTANIKAGLKELVKDAVAGDVLFFHYSGHGSQVYDYSGDEADDMDEIICPIDLDWNEKIITDDELKEIFDTVPAGVNLTVILDCCNSGSGLDQQNQYQPLGEARKIEKPGRFITPPSEMLKEGVESTKPRVLTRNVNNTGLLISGCQSHQTSADAYINGDFYGACTYFVVDVLKKNNYNVTYETLVNKLNSHMVTYHFTQRPELNGNQALFGNKFLEPLVQEEPLPVIEVEEIIEEEPPTVYEPAPEEVPMEEVDAMVDSIIEEIIEEEQIEEQNNEVGLTGIPKLIMMLIDFIKGLFK